MTCYLSTGATLLYVNLPVRNENILVESWRGIPDISAGGDE
jgi:hypothetical protein